VPALKVAFDLLPVARFGSLFEVLTLERPDVRLEWMPVAFPRQDRSPLDGADVGLFLEPQLEPGLRSLMIDVSRMVVVMAVGHRLARHHELRVAEVLDESFLDSAAAHPAWRAFWTLDAQRGGAPPRNCVEISDHAQAIEAVAAGRAIATFPESLAEGLPHPGVISLPLVDGPAVTMRLVWRAGEGNRAVQALVEIARDMFGDQAREAECQPG
jgi:DNA-binding transcriptional LysR family regulator